MNIKNKIHNQVGFTLIQVVVAIGLLGGVALVFMQLMKNMGQAQSMVKTVADEIELKTEIRMILDDERYCRISLKDNSFQKKDVDEIDKTTEGLDISLHLSNQAGDTKTLKKFNGANNVGAEDKSQFGNITINTLKLYMNNPTGAGPNYPSGTNQSDFGIIRAIIKKRDSQISKILDFSVKVTFSTTSGITQIISCVREEVSQTNFEYPNSCSMTFSQSDSGGPFKGTKLNMDSGGFIAIRLVGDVNADDRFRLESSCTSTSLPIESYISNCIVGFGWRDVSSASSPANAVPNPSKAYNATFGSTITLQTAGDVGADDSFYFRLRCPNGGNSDLNRYVKRKCQMCMAHSDANFISPQTTACKKVQDVSDDTWGRIKLSGDVGADDSLYLGFFCEGEYSPLIKSWSY